ncbi:MAG: response regulator [Elusimicrobia bacterium]|nr:response regulator [Elusimicrobiota bacterium]
MLALIADDEPVVRKILARVCARCGLDVETVSSGLAALEAARRMRPDLVLSDLHMPGEVDGLQACSIIRRELPGTTVVMMTGDAEAAAALRAAGFSLLAKPFGAEEAARFVAGAVGGR